MELDFTQADTGNSITRPIGNLRPSSSSSKRRDASLVSGFGAPSINRTFIAKRAPNIAEEIEIYENPLPPISTSNGESCPDLGAMKMMITSHPRFSSLVEAYADCLKIGAPPQLAAQLESRQRAARSFHGSSSNDAELTQFMEEYYNVLVVYREELKKPLEEAMDFVRRAEFQLSELSNGSLWLFSEANLEDAGSSEEMGNACGRGREPGKDREFKNLLLKKYGEQLCSLKQEMSKKKSKNSKLPKEAVEKLIRWWEQHYIWPYPSESEKMALVDSTGLTQTQISNWFINQRKRHWKPPEDARSAVAAAVYMARQSSGDGRTKDWP